MTNEQEDYCCKHGHRWESYWRSKMPDNLRFDWCEQCMTNGDETTYMPLRVIVLRTHYRWDAALIDMQEGNPGLGNLQ